MKLATDELPCWSLINLSMLLYLQSHDWWHIQEHGISFDFPVENKSTKRKLLNLFESAGMFHHSFYLSKNVGDVLLIGVWTSDKTLRLVFGILRLGVSISEETLLLINVISLLRVWISDKMVPILFDIFLPSVWIWDETLLLVFDILLFGAWTSDETFHVVFDIMNCEIRQWL